MGINRRIAAALLSLALATSANASTITVAVPKKSVQDLLNAANPVLNENPLGYVQAYDSPFQYQQRPYSVPVQQKITIPSSAIKSAVKSTLKTNAAAVAMHGAMAVSVAAVGWVIDEAGQPVKKVDGQPANTDPTKSEYNWIVSGYTENHSTPAAACQSYGNRVKSDATLASADAKYVSDTEFQCSVVTYYNPSFPTKYTAQLLRSGSKCPSTTTYNSSTGACLAQGTAPLTDTDYNALDSYIDGQTAQFRADLLKQSCEGALSPARCFQALQDAASFLNSGPSSIQGPTSSSTTTSKNADGTTSITTTNSDTKFKTEYNSDGVTVKPEKTTTIKNPDGSTSETIEKEEDNSTTVQKPGESEEDGEDPLDKDYTFTNPDMPEVPSFYEQKYPDGLQSVWDDNKARFDNSAFIAFLKSFVPSFSGSCPTWGLAMNILPQASYGYMNFANICYVFDFVKVVIIATAVFTARKIMFGG